jgi:soluble lytic murein transglycosylase
MLKFPPLKTHKPLLIASGVALLALLGSFLLAPKAIVWLEEWQQAQLEKRLQEDSRKPSAVLNLVSLPPAQRQAQLKQIAAKQEPSLDRSRARYLLAADLIKKYEGGPALRQLEGLEKEYPTLAPYVLLKRGRAYELTNENQQAASTWQQLLQEYPDSPAVIEALYHLNRLNPEYGKRAIAQYPSHPHTLDIARQRLKDNPKQPQLLLLLAKYDPSNPATNSIRDRLVKDYASQLSPADWETIADGYWEVRQYKKAAPAYRQAPPTPRNRYRVGRGLQLSGQGAEAKQAYQQMVKAFPNQPETGLALRRLASLSPRQEALGYLNAAIAKFPEEAPTALLEKAKILEAMGSQKAAAQARQALLNRYPKSEAAVEYRWQVAQKSAAAGELLKAWQWAQPISTNNPESSLAPKAAFWVGKWAEELGRSQDAKAAFEHVLGRYPQSYYAWRSAVHLGWQVGDFTNVRYLSPALNKPAGLPGLPTGSQALQELYRLGQYEDARYLFQAEVGKVGELTVEQQFAEALLKLAQGQHLQGINQVWELQEREEPEERQQWEKLRQTGEYWQALFPFPFYQTIRDWSGKRQLNPLLVTSLIRQESRFEPEIRSPAGALGLMQVMPGTGQWVADKIQLKDYSLTNPDQNVNLGTWYLDYTHREYGNNSLLAVASYNAGPGNVAQWVKKYGLDDFDAFVEKIPFRETKGYVESVFGNYWNYLRIYNPKISQLLPRFAGR